MLVFDLTVTLFTPLVTRGEQKPEWFEDKHPRCLFFPKETVEILKVICVKETQRLKEKRSSFLALAFSPTMLRCHKTSLRVLCFDSPFVIVIIRISLYRSNFRVKQCRVGSLVAFAFLLQLP